MISFRTSSRPAATDVLGPEMLTAAGFPAAEGWYATTPRRTCTEDTKAAQFVQHYKTSSTSQPDDYAITAYDAAW